MIASLTSNETRVRIAAFWCGGWSILVIAVNITPAARGDIAAIGMFAAFALSTALCGAAYAAGKRPQYLERAVRLVLWPLGVLFAITFLAGMLDGSSSLSVLAFGPTIVLLGSSVERPVHTILSVVAISSLAVLLLVLFAAIALD